MACHGLTIVGTVVSGGTFPTFDIGRETFPSSNSSPQASWVDYNAEFMPFLNGAACNEACAQDIFNYLQSLVDAMETVSLPVETDDRLAAFFASLESS